MFKVSNQYYHFLYIVLVAFSLTENSYTANLNIPLIEIPKLNPYRGNEINMNRVLNQVTEGLIALDSSLYPIPLLADKWETNIGKKTIIFTLGEKKFHDGSSLEVQDVFNCFIDGRNFGSSLTSQIKGFEKCSKINECSSFEVLSNRKFRLHLKGNNFSFFLRQLASIEGVIFKKSKNGKIIGTGPYRLSLMDSNKVELSRVSSAAYHDNINFQKIQSSDAVRLFKEGKIDTIDNITFKINPKNIPNNFSYQDSSIVTFALVLNTNKGILRDRKIRRAISMGIDREKLLKASGKIGAIATGLIPKGFMGYRERKYIFDPSKAKNIIANRVSKKDRNLSIILRQDERSSLAKFLKNLSIQ